MKSSPSIPAPDTFTDHLTGWIGWGLLATLWGFVAYTYPSLPETIPTHFNLAGVPDGWGSRATLWALPGVATLICILLTVLSYFPQSFNYPVPITPDNAARQYRYVTQMLRHLKIAIVLLFGLIVVTLIHAGRTGTDSLGLWLLPILLVIVLAPVVGYMIRAARRR
ncbi:MAG: DUF1648 domain-containing protein [Bacteroidia bacterium]|nr:DUF1648 domain-containing protein [Bacteroidia bacterium]